MNNEATLLVSPQVLFEHISKNHGLLISLPFSTLILMSSHLICLISSHLIPYHFIIIHISPYYINMVIRYVNCLISFLLTFNFFVSVCICSVLECCHHRDVDANVDQYCMFLFTCLDHSLSLSLDIDMSER